MVNIWLLVSTRISELLMNVPEWTTDLSSSTTSINPRSRAYLHYSGMPSQPAESRLLIMNFVGQVSIKSRCCVQQSSCLRVSIPFRRNRFRVRASAAKFIVVRSPAASRTFVLNSIHSLLTKTAIPGLQIWHHQIQLLKMICVDFGRIVRCR